jgi:hypothetical protein
MKIRITNEALFNAKKVEAEFVGTTLNITYYDDDTLKTIEAWGEIGESDYEEQLGFQLLNHTQDDTD